MESHKYANLFPMMDNEQHNNLKKDIKENGLIQPIIKYKDTILDGRNRLKACNELGITPNYEEFKGNDPLQYVISTNLQRRHLTASQRVMIARKSRSFFAARAKERQIKSGEEYGKGVELIPQPIEEQGKARDELGEAFNVSGRYIDEAERIIEKKPELEEQIISGEKTITEGVKEIKQEERKEKIEEQKKRIKLENLKQPKGDYDCIVIDPPWKVNHQYTPDHYMGRVANPYPEMDIKQIKSIILPAKDNCILWLWTTHSQIQSAFEIMKEWGFEYKAILTWNKESMGIGHWLRKQCEFCLMGIKGKPIWTATDVRDIIIERRTTHSTKPESFYEMVNKTCTGKKLEYFSRKKRKGWDVYGDEVKE